MKKSKRQRQINKTREETLSEDSGEGETSMPDQNLAIEILDEEDLHLSGRYYLNDQSSIPFEHGYNTNTTQFGGWKDTQRSLETPWNSGPDEVLTGSTNRRNLIALKKAQKRKKSRREISKSRELSEKIKYKSVKRLIDRSRRNLIGALSGQLAIVRTPKRINKRASPISSTIKSESSIPMKVPPEIRELIKSINCKGEYKLASLKLQIPKNKAHQIIQQKKKELLRLQVDRARNGKDNDKMKSLESQSLQKKSFYKLKTNKSKAGVYHGYKRSMTDFRSVVQRLPGLNLTVKSKENTPMGRSQPKLPKISSSGNIGIRKNFSKPRRSFHAQKVVLDNSTDYVIETPNQLGKISQKSSGLDLQIEEDPTPAKPMVGHLKDKLKTSRIIDFIPDSAKKGKSNQTEIKKEKSVKKEDKSIERKEPGKNTIPNEIVIPAPKPDKCSQQTKEPSQSDVATADRSIKIKKRVKPKVLTLPDRILTKPRKFNQSSIIPGRQQTETTDEFGSMSRRNLSTLIPNYSSSKKSFGQALKTISRLTSKDGVRDKPEFSFRETKKTQDTDSKPKRHKRKEKLSVIRMITHEPVKHGLSKNDVERASRRQSVSGSVGGNQMKHKKDSESVDHPKAHQPVNRDPIREKNNRNEIERIIRKEKIDFKKLSQKNKALLKKMKNWSFWAAKSRVKGKSYIPSKVDKHHQTSVKANYRDKKINYDILTIEHSAKLKESYQRGNKDDGIAKRLRSLTQDLYKKKSLEGSLPVKKRKALNKAYTGYLY